MKVFPHYERRESIVLTHYIKSETEQSRFSKMSEKEKQAYKSFKEFHQQYR